MHCWSGSVTPALFFLCCSSMLTTFWHFHAGKTFSAQKFKNAKATKGNKEFPKLLMLLDLLEHSPSLKNLKFCQHSITKDNVKSIERTVSLPLLESLVMDGHYDRETLKSFLTSLVLPKRTDITLHT